MADIFISYASEDRSRVELLAEALEEQGWSVWWDRTIPPGKTFDQVIEEAIDASRCVVVLWSKKSIKSDWVKEEANIGKERKILVPTKIDPVDLPLGFGRIQAADLTNWEEKKEHPEFINLRNAISEVAGPPPERDKGVPDTKLPESNLEQQVKTKSEESETFQPDPSHLKPDEKEPPIAASKALGKKRLAFGLGAAALIAALSVIGWLLYQNLKPELYTITASSGPNGSISPTHAEVIYGGSQSFEIKPNPGYQIADVRVDDIFVRTGSSHTIKNVTSDRTISASFSSKPLTKLINLARQEGATASQSSDRDPNNGAGKAIDGNRDGNFWNNSVTHTKDEPNSWWQLELPLPAKIESIHIWNRTDTCCRNRLSNLRISVKSDSDEVVKIKNFVGSEIEGDSKLFEFDPPVMGRFVNIEIIKENLAKNGILSLAEVEVWGEFIK